MKVQLSLNATGLKNVAGAFKGTSDPFAVVTHIPEEKGAKPAVIGKTEVIKNCLDPDWTKVFVFDYELGQEMTVIISIYDEVRKSGRHISMGSAIFEIGSLLGKRGNTKAKKLKNGGVIVARVEKSVGSGILRLKMKGTKLTNTEGFLRKSDPFFEMLRYSNLASGTTWDNVYRSKTVMDNLNPVWDDVVANLSVLCNGDTEQPVKVAVYDREKKGDHVFMGSFETTVNQLVEAQASGNGITLEKEGKKTGTITVLKADIVGTDELSKSFSEIKVDSSENIAPSLTKDDYPSFVDYISGGCEMNLTVAIDFTGSNGDPRDPNTLHHRFSDGRKNDYEKAIMAICRILANYDSNQMFPVLGFGAKYDGIVRHCFQCGPTREVKGVQGILDAYHHVFNTGLIMSGPTVFEEVIQTAAATAASAQDAANAEGKQKYSILLILTDGAVTDVGTTADALLQASDAPLSVIIVGVGNADFTGMQFLDDLKSSGKRDIVQFVDFNSHSSNASALTKATLDEIPLQLVSYFKGQGIMPNQPESVEKSEVRVEDEEEEIDLSLEFADDDDQDIVVGATNVTGRAAF